MGASRDFPPLAGISVDNWVRSSVSRSGAWAPPLRSASHCSSSHPLSALSCPARRSRLDDPPWPVAGSHLLRTFDESGKGCVGPGKLQLERYMSHYTARNGIVGVWAAKPWTTAALTTDDWTPDRLVPPLVSAEYVGPCGVSGARRRGPRASAAILPPAAPSVAAAAKTTMTANTK
jgi:hypothetical protein